MKVTCEACGANHRIDPPPWILRSGRPFPMTCPSCNHTQDVQPPVGITTLPGNQGELVSGEEAERDEGAPGPTPAAPAQARPEAPTGFGLPDPGEHEAVPSTLAMRPPTLQPHEAASLDARAPRASGATDGPAALASAVVPSDPDDVPKTLDIPEFADDVPAEAAEPPPPAPPEDAPFRLRYHDVIEAFATLADVQRRVLEGRVAPDDALSERGGPWHRAGNRDDLAWYFRVVSQVGAASDAGAGLRSTALPTDLGPPEHTAEQVTEEAARPRHTPRQSTLAHVPPLAVSAPATAAEPFADDPLEITRESEQALPPEPAFTAPPTPPPVRTARVRTPSTSDDADTAPRGRPPAPAPAVAVGTQSIAGLDDDPDFGAFTNTSPSVPSDLPIRVQRQNIRPGLAAAALLTLTATAVYLGVQAGDTDAGSADPPTAAALDASPPTDAAASAPAEGEPAPALSADDAQIAAVVPPTDAPPKATPPAPSPPPAPARTTTPAPKPAQTPAKPTPAPKPAPAAAPAPAASAPARPAQPAPAPAPKAPTPPPSQPVPTGDAATLVDRGWAQVEAGKLSAAQASFQGALAADGRNADARYGLGYTLLELGQAAEGGRQLCLALKSASPALRREIEGVLGGRRLRCL